MTKNGLKQARIKFENAHRKKANELRSKFAQLKEVIKQTTNRMCTELFTQQVILIDKLEKCEANLNDHLVSLKVSDELDLSEKCFSELDRVKFEYELIHLTRLTHLIHVIHFRMGSLNALTDLREFNVLKVFMLI